MSAPASAPTADWTQIKIDGVFVNFSEYNTDDCLAVYHFTVDGDDYELCFDVSEAMSTECISLTTLPDIPFASLQNANRLDITSNDGYDNGYDSDDGYADYGVDFDGYDRDADYGDDCGGRSHRCNWGDRETSGFDINFYNDSDKVYTITFTNCHNGYYPHDLFIRKNNAIWFRSCV